MDYRLSTYFVFLSVVSWTCAHPHGELYGPGICCGKPPGWYVDKDDADKFYLCHQDTAFEFSCSQSERYDYEMTVCGSNPTITTTQPPPDPTAGVGSCNSANCRLPDCLCPNSGIPGNIPYTSTPMIVFLSFDDAIELRYKSYFEGLQNLKNPNGCPAKFTYFASLGGNMDWALTKNLSLKGHQIGSHSISHRTPNIWWQNATYEQYVEEMVGMRNLLAQNSDIPIGKIRATRVPYLRTGGNPMYKMLEDYHFNIDSSLPTDSYSWPYNMKYQTFPQNCDWLNCPTGSFPGVWQFPLAVWRNGSTACRMPDNCGVARSKDNIKRYLWENFNRHLSNNKGPLTLAIHTRWFINNEFSYSGLLEFLQEITQRQDTWLLSMSQALDWIQYPNHVLAPQYSGIPTSWQCKI